MLKDHLRVRLAQLEPFKKSVENTLNSDLDFAEKLELPKTLKRYLDTFYRLTSL